MRIFPDFHFRQHFKERYADNYEKINTKLEERAEERRNRTPVSPETVKRNTVGFAASVIIIGCFFAVGIYINQKSSEKELRIAELENSIAYTDSLIKQYQIINGDEVREQMTEAVSEVTALQNQYAKQDFTDDFDIRANRYLGNYNNNWADGFDLTEPLWQGYINKAHEFGDTANFLLILYDSKAPVMIVDVSFSMDAAGNLGTMTNVRKTRLV